LHDQNGQHGLTSFSCPLYVHLKFFCYYNPNAQAEKENQESHPQATLTPLPFNPSRFSSTALSSTPQKFIFLAHINAHQQFKERLIKGA
jgi:hypothetical protein